MNSFFSISTAVYRTAAS